LRSWTGSGTQVYPALGNAENRHPHSDAGAPTWDAIPPELLFGADPSILDRAYRGEGGNVFPGHWLGGAHTPEEDPKTWRTEKTNIPLIMGLFPPNVMPEEIDNDHPRRLAP